ncbi:hypothetical protein [Bradyrhizobium sp. CCBAU 45384]|uniref:hypothetical protein n=1 Tax=Bradyrhizobium sp. CCBAU 45384 TaxID=858428 RepID=UPI002306390A|nr:hypothetical protein [Bradyrhizobium sp. CCBAU 45384]
MITLETLSAVDVSRKVADCLYFARWRSRSRPHLPQIDVTAEYLLKLLRRQNFRCALTGVPLTKSGPQSATIDRIVGARGYCKRNVRWVAKFANNAKGSMSDPEFANWWESFILAIRRRKIG